MGLTDASQSTADLLSDAYPECRKRESLTIMHVTLRWIISEYTVRDDLLFALVEPTSFASETGGCLVRARRKVEVGEDAHDAG